MRVKLAHNGHDIEALAITFKNGECGVEVTIEWLEGIVEKKKKFEPAIRNILFAKRS
jgi:hypothetical protein